MAGLQGVPQKKPTNVESELIKETVIKLLGLGKRPGQIKKAVSKRFGIKPRTVEGYLSRARAEMREQSGMSIEDHRSDAYQFYSSVLADPTASNRDKIKARERMDKLLGLEIDDRRAMQQTIIDKAIMLNQSSDEESLLLCMEELSDDQLAALAKLDPASMGEADTEKIGEPVIDIIESSEVSTAGT